MQTDEARSRFQPEQVDASGADFSDRLDGSKRFYKTSKRRRRRRRDEDGEGDGYFGDLSDEEEETLERRIARLRQEIEEVKMELAEKDAPDEITSTEKDSTQPEPDEEDTLANITKLSQAVDVIYAARHGESKGAEADLVRTINKFDRSKIPSAQSNRVQIQNQASTANSANQAELHQALSKAAEFDGRLTFLEHSLGLNGMNIPDQGVNSSKPILHTLDTLDRQVQTVSNSSASIDAAQSKARQLVKDAERLQKLRSTQDEQNGSSAQSDGLKANGHIEDPERTSKIIALYGTLPTIDLLAPTLPMVLDRLRTLRLLHTSAASASNTLDEMEKRQSGQAAEIKQWREALENVELNLKKGEGGLTENVKTVGDWVRDLEARMSRVG